MEKILEKRNLKMKPTKTETLKIGSDNEWEIAKKLGMLFDTKQEWKRRKHLTTTAMFKLRKIWNSSITRNKKIRIYKDRWTVSTEKWCGMYVGFFDQTA